MRQETVDIQMVVQSATNPRKHFDETELAELAQSVKKHGVLQPILVRLSQANGRSLYEIVAGERRWRAARLAGLAAIPVIIGELSDDEVIEIQVIENLQRADLSPLEESEAYQTLIAHGYDVARIAERTGRSPKYIYDRVRLKDLAAPARNLLEDGTIQPGHAILLSRLSPADQKRVIGDENDYAYMKGGLFERQRGLPFDANGEDRPPPFKAVTVRELQRYIDEHVRLVPSAPDLPELFPDASAAVETHERVVLITRANYIDPVARVGDRIIFPRSWRRADGNPDTNDPSSYEWRGYKPLTCAHSILGFVAVGPGRGEAFPVCIDKKRCATHWGDAQRAAKKRAKEKGGSAASGESRAESNARKREAEREAEQKRIKKALPALKKAMIEAIQKAPADAKSVVGKDVMDWWGIGDRHDEYPTPVTAEDIVRAAAAQHLIPSEYDDIEKIVADFKLFGLDAKKIIDEHASDSEVPPVTKKSKRKAKAT